MISPLDRRTFSKAIAAAVAGALAPTPQARQTRRLTVGHTGITWGFAPADAEAAIKDVGSLGYHGYESFGNVLESWEPKGGLDRLLTVAKLPLRSAYCPVTLTDPAVLADEIAKMIRWAGLIRKCGGSVAVIGPNGVKRPDFVFADHRSQIVAALNDIGKALDDAGVVGVLHQHTGTCVETRDETYAVMEAVNTRYVRFGPDVGQLQKGGADPVQVVKDFLPVIRHVHLKDFSGGEPYLGYSPLGLGKVDLKGVVDLLESSGQELMIMAELDPSPKMPRTPLEAAQLNKACLQTLGYQFRT